MDPADHSLRQRTSIGIPTTTTTTTTSSSSSTSTAATSSSSSSSSSFSLSSSVDFELNSIKSTTSYTSLRDILPSPATVVNSPKASRFAIDSGYEISIRNRLVKQAAWAYLQPMSTSPEVDGSTFFHRLWTQFSGAVIRFVTSAFDCLLRSIQVGTTSSKL